MSDGTIFKVQKKVASISLDEPLRRVFQGFCEGGSEMSIGQFVQFAAEKKLIDKLWRATTFPQYLTSSIAPTFQRE